MYQSDKDEIRQIIRDELQRYDSTALRDLLHRVLDRDTEAEVEARALLYGPS